MITFINEDGIGTATAATLDAGGLRLPAQSLHEMLGWELKPQGLCQDDRCIPVQADADLVTGTQVNLSALAQLLDQPLVVDADERVAYLGESAQERGAALSSLEAPDFTLPDLHGRLHSLSDYRGKRVLLVAHASW